MSKVVPLSVKVPEELAEQIQASADAAGMNRHAWMQMVLRYAVDGSPIRRQLNRLDDMDPEEVRDGRW